MLIRRSILFLLLVPALVTAASCRESRGVAEQSATDPPKGCEEFHRLVTQTYDFKPTKLTEAQRSAKSAEMDKVWQSVKTDKEQLIPCLKAELRADGANKFFLFDGATLLASLEDSDESKRLLIQSFARADLEDMVLQNWIAPILRYALEGYDVSPAGDAWLRAKEPKYFLPQHGTLAVNKEIGALGIFGSMDETIAVRGLERIVADPAHPGREIAVQLLARIGTEESNEVLSKIDLKNVSSKTSVLVQRSSKFESSVSPREGSPKVTRDEYLAAFDKLTAGNPADFMRLVSRADDGERDAIVVLKSEDLPRVRRARRFFASTGTPHLAEWYDSFTAIIFALEKKAKS
jgi:hypothetical protein